MFHEKKNKPDMRDFRLLSYPLHQEFFNFDHKWIITFSVRVQSNLNFPKGSPKIYRTCNANLERKKNSEFFHENLHESVLGTLIETH